MAIKSSERRRTYFIERGLQLKFCLIIFMAALVISGIAIWTTFVATWGEMSAEMNNPTFAERLALSTVGAADGQMAQILGAIFAVEFSRVFDRVTGLLVLRLIAGSVLLFGLSVFASHKLAGPVYRIKRAADSMARGDFNINLTHLRRGDELRELALAIHTAAASLKDRMRRCRHFAGRMDDLSERMMSCLKESNPDLELARRLAREMDVVGTKLVMETGVPGGQNEPPESELT